MPEQEMHTTSFWLHLPAAFLQRFPDIPAADRQGGMTALGTALRSVAALLLMCDPHDMGIAITEDVAPGAGGIFEPNLYLYDSYPGGAGQSSPLFRLAPRLFRNTLDLLRNCPCEQGCPSCTGPIGEVGERGKEAATRFLTALCA
jgi:DEAD/DEAH box helicase domain-containing protein